MDTRYTTTQQVVKLIGSHTISKVTVKIGDLKRTKMVRTINLYYNNRTVQAIVELKNKYGLCRCPLVQLCPAGCRQAHSKAVPLSHNSVGMGSAVRLLTAKRGQERFLPRVGALKRGCGFSCLVESSWHLGKGSCGSAHRKQYFSVFCPLHFLPFLHVPALLLCPQDVIGLAVLCSFPRDQAVFESLRC